MIIQPGAWLFILYTLTLKSKQKSKQKIYINFVFIGTSSKKGTGETAWLFFRCFYCATDLLSIQI